MSKYKTINTLPAEHFRIVIVTHLVSGQALHAARYFSSAMANFQSSSLKDFPKVEGAFIRPWHKGFQPPSRSKPSASSASAAADGDQASVTAGFCVLPEKQAADEAAVDGDRASDSEWEMHPNKQAANEAAVEIKQLDTDQRRLDGVLHLPLRKRQADDRYDAASSNTA